MNDRLWKKFENTGSVEDYLAYRKVGLRKESGCHGENGSDGDCFIGRTHK